MRLMSATQVDEQKKRNQEREALRVSQLNNFVVQKTKDINILDQSYKEKKQTLERDFHDYFNEITAKKRSLLGEVLELEQRKKEALIPITTQKQEVQKLLTLQKDTEQVLKGREKELDKKQNLLMRLEDKLEDREYEVTDKEISLVSRISEMDSREQLLRKEEGIFNHRFTEAQTRFQEREAAITEKEKVLTAGMEWVKRREEALEKETKELSRKQVAYQKNLARYTSRFESLKEKGGDK